MPLPRCPSPGLGGDPILREIPEMPSVWHAGESLLPPTLHYEGISDWGREKAAAGGGSPVGSCPPTAVLDPWRCVGTSGGF